MSDSVALQTYLDRYFVQLDDLARLGGVSPAEVAALIAARAIPQPIYTIWPNGAFSSPIGGPHGAAPHGEPTHWYSPAAAWWIRRSRGLSPVDASARFEARFVADFVTRLPLEPQAPLGYAQVFATGRFDAAAAQASARAEWNDWIDGGYGVCLRYGDAHHAITKTCRRAAVLVMTDEGRRPELTPTERDALLDVMEELEAVMLPFAPHQRPQGTPGLWLDAVLARYGLGTTRDAQQAVGQAMPPRLCA
ncbi:DUF6058 family natural product biosynthesis protein [Devosia lacusdianchii]|uniref:DUF6058 family natural product biosynthesis protein n=1 Tax=Devosia lacusdianchii TaxID=2917991 RepID=UPI001F05F504|nr:DUF6058 family natural product biosynthesis protein [Devosia sp. JXJ CY 41]